MIKESYRTLLCLFDISRGFAELTFDLLRATRSLGLDRKERGNALVCGLEVVAAKPASNVFDLLEWRDEDGVVVVSEPLF